MLGISNAATKRVRTKAKVNTTVQTASPTTSEDKASTTKEKASEEKATVNETSVSFQDVALFNLRGNVKECVINTKYPTWNGSEKLRFSEYGTLELGLGFEFEFDRKGKQVSAKVNPDHWGGITVEAERNRSGRLIGIHSFKKGNQGAMGGYSNQEMRFVYDENGRLASQLIYVNDELEVRETLTYDAKGNVATCKMEFEGASTLITKFEYTKFDKKGNWTERQYTDSESTKPTIETRIITYYD